MLSIYLPIAGLSVSLPLLIGLGAGVGLLSGLFGVGGGFLLTPLLILLGVPAPIAAASGANQLIGSSVSGVLFHWRRRNVDVRMGLVLLAGGLVGSVGGVFLSGWLKRLGQIDLVIAVAFAGFLGIVGLLMLGESVTTLIRARRGGLIRRKLHPHGWTHGLPLKMRFRRSRLYISVLPPILIGAMVGVMVAVMGVGGGFVMVPAMVYLLDMPTALVVGTSLFQIIFLTAATTFLQAVANQSVDAVLALILLAGGVVGSQFGVRLSTRLKGEQLRIILALIVLGVGVKLALDLARMPAELYSLS